ncbi:cytidine deaminase [Leucobacter komagatae]|uniref:cytidine deaminase n=1 Tax=Leucobacter komagatae TaxID=55969 RepID=UPI0006982A1E|nr:cytidine deaminase [Leucobacter komagatae]
MIHDISQSDAELIEAAASLLTRVHDPAAVRVAAAARGVSGAIYLGVSLATPRVKVCAESTAIANAKIGGDAAITRVVSVGLGPDDVPHVINPCGVCRELVPRFGEDLNVLVDIGDGRVAAVRPDELLPMPWVRARSYDD